MATKKKAAVKKSATKAAPKKKAAVKRSPRVRNTNIITDILAEIAKGAGATIESSDGVSVDCVPAES